MNDIIQMYEVIKAKVAEEYDKTIQPGVDIESEAFQLQRALDIEVAVTKNAFEHRKTMGQVAMKALWNIMQLPYQSVSQANDLSSYFLEKVGVSEDTDYVFSIVERIFPVVHERWMAGEPFIVNGEPVSVDDLIERRGLVRKLKRISFSTAQALESGDYEKIQQNIELVLTKSATEVDNAMRPKVNTVRVKIEYDDNMVIPHFAPMPREMWNMVQARLYGMLDEEL